MDRDATIVCRDTDARRSTDGECFGLLSCEPARTFADARAHTSAGASGSVNPLSLSALLLAHNLSLRAFDLLLRVAHRDVHLSLGFALCLARFLCQPRSLNPNARCFRGYRGTVY